MTTTLKPGVPLHEQISSWLRRQIESGEWAPDAQLPSEHDLCEQFGVSRVTVRQALRTLEADGLIFRRQGLGSFVCDRKLPQGLVRLTDFSQDMARAGLRAESVVLHQEQEECPPGVASRLGVEPGSPVVRLDRLRLGDGDPIAFDQTWIPLFHAQLLAGRDLARETLYEILERDFGIPILSGRYRISAALADPAFAGPLGVCPGEALLLIERTSRTVGDRVVYFQRRFYRADRTSYELEVGRDPAQLRIPGADAGGMPLREFEAVFHGADKGPDAAQS
jgi:GntR family transcriptional regulator